MPDNNKNSVIDEQFTDLAWENMRSRLDEAMPVATPHKKRRFLILLLLFGLVLGGLTVLWGIQSPDQQRKGNDSNKPIATVQEMNQAPDLQKSRVADDCLEEQQANIAQNVIETQKTPYVPNPKTKITEPETVTQPPIPGLAQIHSNAPKPIKANESTEQAPIVQVHTPEPLRKEFQNLTSLPIEIKELAHDFEMENPMVVPTKKRKTGLISALAPARFGVEGGVLSNRLAAVDGFHLGLTARYNLGKNPWSLHTGLSYAMQRQVFSYGRSNKNTSSDELGGFDPNFDTESSQDTSISTVNDPLGFGNLAQYATSSFSTTIHRLEVPILFSYKADDRLHLDFGVQGSYILAAKSNGTSSIIQYADNYLRFDAASDPEQALSESGGAFSVQNVNRFGVALRGGLSYYPAKNLGLRLHYQLGLINTSEANSYRSYNRAVRFSTVYYF